MDRRPSFQSIDRQAQQAIHGLKVVTRLRTNQLVKVFAELSRHLLFPLLAWVAFQLLVGVFPSSGLWNLNLITTFFLPLLSIFVVYRAIAAIIFLTLGQVVYTALVQRFLFPLFLTYAVIQFMELFTDISVLGDIQLFTIAKTTLTLRGLFFATVGLWLWLAGISGLAICLRQLIHLVLLDRLSVNKETLEAWLILLRYFLIGLGLFAVFSELKLDSNAVAAISGGLAVGIGFGLKDIIVNFLSGIILLFENTLRPGDVIQVDSKMGRVEEISLRATTIRTNDYLELVIPNQVFWTNILTSYTRTSRTVRFQLEISVGYEYLPETITAILLDAVQQDARILTSPAAKVEISNFNQQGVIYKLQFWTDEPLAINSIRDKIYRYVWRVLQEQGIELKEDMTVSLRNLPNEAHTQLTAKTKLYIDQSQHENESQ